MSSSRKKFPQGFTLVELLVSAAVSSIIIVLVATLFNSSAAVMADGQRNSDVFSEGRAAMEFIRRDLEGCVTSKYRESGLPTIGVKFAMTEKEQYGTFDQRYFVPFEHNRYHGLVFEDRSSPPTGTALKRAIMNAQTNLSGDRYHENYDTLAFTTRSNLERQVHTAVDRGQGAGFSDNVDNNYRNTGDICLSAFYVAYTYDSPLENANASMKLFRHFRDSGSANTGHRHEASDGAQQGVRHLQSRAQSVLIKVSEPTVALIPTGVHQNDKLPYLLTPVNKYYGEVGTTRQWFDTQHIWPVNPVALNVPLPTGMPTKRERYSITSPTSHLLEDNYVWPDEPLAFNVISFKCRPLRRHTNGKFVAAEDLNSSYNLNAANRTEWPVLLAPDIVEIELRVLSDEAAAKFLTQDDWTNWQSKPHLTTIVERESRVFRETIYVGNADIAHSR